MIVVPSARSEPPTQPPGPRSIEALIIDRQPLFQAALANLLQGPPISAHIVSTSRSDLGLEILRARAHNIVFCELRAQPLSGIELVKTLTLEDNNVPVVLLADEGDEYQLASGLTTAAAGLFTKNAGLEEFLTGVQAVVSGHRALGSGLMGRLLERLSRSGAQDPRRLANQLSPTEFEILAMVARADSIPAIAASRGISHKTVRNHLAKIYRKLELHGRTEAMLWAARMGLTGS